MWNAQGFSRSEIDQFAFFQIRLGQDAGNHAVRSALENEPLEADVGRHDVRWRSDFLAEMLAKKLVLQRVLVVEYDGWRSVCGLPVEPLWAVARFEFGCGHAQVFHVAQVVGEQSLEICRGRGDGTLNLP